MPGTTVPGMRFIIIGKIVVAEEWSAIQLFIVRAQVMNIFWDLIVKANFDAKVGSDLVHIGIMQLLVVDAQIRHRLPLRAVIEQAH